MLRTQVLVRQLHNLSNPGSVLRKQCGFCGPSHGRWTLASSHLRTVHNQVARRDGSWGQRNPLCKSWPSIATDAPFPRMPKAPVVFSTSDSAQFADFTSERGDGSGGNEGGGNSGGGGHGDGHSGAGDSRKYSRLWAFWLWYLERLDSNPIFTKALTSALLTLIGDVSCQFAVENSSSLDAKRSFIMTALGFALTGPTLHFWYLTLHRVVTVGGPVGLGIRLALDQFAFSPVFIAVFIGSLMTLEGKGDQVVPKLKQDLWQACLANWKLWIPTQTINFMFVPQKLQVGFANIVALAWNTYMSYQSHKKVEVKSTQMEELPANSS